MSRLEYKEFIKEVAENIKDYLPTEYANASISIEDITKNNNTLTKALLIKTDEQIVTPTIYLNQYYDKYQDGVELESIFQQIAACRVNNDVKSEMNFSFINDWNISKELVIPRLLGIEGNEQYLAEKPHTMLADLAITYCISIDFDEELGKGTIAVTDKILENWGISLDELHQAAINNMPTLSKSSFKGMSSIWNEIGLDDIEDLDYEPMYILSNESGTFGSANLLDTELMTNIVNRFNSFYIIPSSIHEVLIVPDIEVELEQLKDLVKTVNDTQLKPQEILSYNVYKYSNETGLYVA